MSESPARRSSSPEAPQSSKPDASQAQKTKAKLVGPNSARLKPLRPPACRSYIRKRVAAAWPFIVEVLLEKAKEGSVPHTSLAAKLAGFGFRPEPVREPKRREKSFAKQLLEEIDELEAKNIAEFGPL